MAGDWIKMRCNLWSHPKVVKLASRLSVTNVTVIGALHGVWTVADQHASDDGVLEMSAEALNKFAQVPDFCAALESVGWLEIQPEYVKFPEYHEHNGTTAKSRASAQKRKQKSRKRVTNVTVDRDQRREEERREDIHPVVAQGADGVDDQDTKPKRKRFTPPTPDEVTAYCQERQNGIDPQAFLDYYEAQGWKLSNGNAMKDWKAAVRNWEARRRDSQKETDGPAEAGDDYV